MFTFHGVAASVMPQCISDEQARVQAIIQDALDAGYERRSRIKKHTSIFLQLIATYKNLT